MESIDLNSSKYDTLHCTLLLAFLSFLIFSPSHLLDSSSSHFLLPFYSNFYDYHLSDGLLISFVIFLLLLRNRNSPNNQKGMYDALPNK